MGWTGCHATHYKRNGDIDRKAECDGYFLEGLNAWSLSHSEKCNGRFCLTTLQFRI